MLPWDCFLLLLLIFLVFHYFNWSQEIYEIVVNNCKIDPERTIAFGVVANRDKRTVETV